VLITFNLNQHPIAKSVFCQGKWAIYVALIVLRATGGPCFPSNPVGPRRIADYITIIVVTNVRHQVKTHAPRVYQLCP
jgi:hypothetical protein